jgi:hypothetical protein
VESPSLENWLQTHRKLLLGDYANFPFHEQIRTGDPRFKDCFRSTPTFGKPIWRGENEKGVVLLNADFGMGDTIHFFRFVSQVRSRVGRVILRCDEDFGSLFSDCEIVGKEQNLPEFDKIAHMMSLPRILDISKKDISGKQFLAPNETESLNPEFLSVVNKMGFFKVGVCCRGNPFNPRDSFRSMPESFLAELINKTKLMFFSLNKLGLPVSLANSLFDLRKEMSNWNRTAHLIRLMDLIISVDTAVAHLAGAMGKPTWLIVPTENPDWRWGLEGSRTLWYDSVKLYRNQDWSETIDVIAQDLLAL